MRSMKKILIILSILIVSINTVYAKEVVKFSKCVDGDTIKVEIDGEVKTVRFLAVDTPESVHPTKGMEYYGKEASNYTCEAVTKAKKIELEYDDNSDKEDKYDRLLAWVWVDDVLLQDELIKNGYAEVTYLYGDYKYTSLLQDHQAITEAKKIGIWNEEARKEYDSAASEKENNSDDNSKENDDIDFKNMSTKEMITLAIGLLIFVLFGSTIKKYKRKLKNLMK